MWHKSMKSGKEDEMLRNATCGFILETRNADIRNLVLSKRIGRGEKIPLFPPQKNVCMYVYYIYISAS